MNDLDPFLLSGRLDAQTEEINRLKGCVIWLGFWVLVLGVSFFFFTLDHAH